ncbi:MAG: hypothetical protein ABS73_15755 [Paracoccus sp. SCN 68-21]|nr:MAG: hypothetical protein ABS73_15755 [Paracoccus sp. SCN 68-21]
MSALIADGFGTSVEGKCPAQLEGVAERGLRGLLNLIGGGRFRLVLRHDMILLHLNRWPDPVFRKVVCFI